MSDWRNSGPEDFALSEKRGGFSSELAESRAKQARRWRWLSIFSTFASVVIAVASIWYAQNATSSGQLELVLLNQSVKIDALEEQLSASADELQELRAVLDAVRVTCEEANSRSTLETACKKLAEKFPTVLAVK